MSKPCEVSPGEASRMIVPIVRPGKFRHKGKGRQAAALLACELAACDEQTSIAHARVTLGSGSQTLFGNAGSRNSVSRPPRPRNRASHARVPKQSLGTR